MYKRAIMWSVLFAVIVTLASSCACPQPKAASAGWQNLITGDLSCWIYKSGDWVLEDGVLFGKGAGCLWTAGQADIWTKQDYANFILDLEFKLAERTNSGIFLRTGSIKNWLNTTIEVQILDSYGKTEADKHDCGAIYDCLAPRKNMVNKPGRWNHCTITCKDSKIYIILNGEKIIDMNLDFWAEPGKNPDGTKNKFKIAYKDMPRKGRIGLQYHGRPVWYRNIRIKALDK